MAEHAHSHAHGRKMYYVTFIILMVGTIVTYLAAKVELGLFNAPVALTIAVTKAVFVVLFFMHVKDSTRLTKVTIVAGVFWLAILLTLTMTDFLTRPWG
jgi:cytochrome c oxidase subunit 4